MDAVTDFVLKNGASRRWCMRVLSFIVALAFAIMWGHESIYQSVYHIQIQAIERMLEENVIEFNEISGLDSENRVLS
jgi:hypothetical protein